MQKGKKWNDRTFSWNLKISRICLEFDTKSWFDKLKFSILAWFFIDRLLRLFEYIVCVLELVFNWIFSFICHQHLHRIPTEIDRKT